MPGAYEHAFFGNSMEEDEAISSDEDEDEERSLQKKVFGRSVGYVFLVNKLKNMWKFAGNFSCVDLGRGFFLIRFDSRTGFEDVLKGGPWFIGEYFLSLRPWVPNFRASEAFVSSVAIWVRLPELPVEYYHKDSLLRIGSGLGPVLRVDFNTAAGTRGRFARICIQLDLEQPLARTIRVGKTKLAVIYEGIGLLCFHFGRIGHRSESCPSRVLEEIETPIDTSTNPKSAEEDKLKRFGPWMLVSRRKRQNKPAGFCEVGSVEGVDASGRANGLGATGRGAVVSDVQGCGSNHQKFRYSPLDKGKTKQAGGLGEVSVSGPSKSKPKSAEQAHFSGLSEPILKSAEPVSRKSLFLLSLSVLNSLNPKAEMTSTCWGVFPLFKDSPSWRIRLGTQLIRIDEDVIELIRKDPLHVWGWYDAEIAQAWSEIAPATQVEDCLDPPRLTDMVWLQEISPFWNFLTDIVDTGGKFDLQVKG
uniref:DUF4283 domain-containing protein n=1 Tax=Fagus sylvatica TaxID=28930 RepID=A0A2N9HK07_FAGSY